MILNFEIKVNPKLKKIEWMSVKCDTERCDTCPVKDLCEEIWEKLKEIKEKHSVERKEYRFKTWEIKAFLRNIDLQRVSLVGIRREEDEFIVEVEA